MDDRAQPLGIAMIVSLWLTMAAPASAHPPSTRPVAAQPPSVPTDISPETSYLLDIPALPLFDALSRYTRITGLQTLVDAEVADDLRTRAIAGRWAPRPALDAMLAGSGLRAVAVNPHTVAVRMEQAATVSPAQSDAIAPAPAAPRQFDTLHVYAPAQAATVYAAQATRVATGMRLSLRETPQSIGVIPQQRIVESAATDIAGILGMATGVTVQELDSERALFYARGDRINELRVDGLPRLDGQPPMDAAFLQRVEVLRGANGLLSGAGFPSATVELIRKAPTAIASTGITLRLDARQLRRIETDVSGPLSADGRLRARLVLAAQRRESHMDFYRERRQAGFASVEYDLSPDTLLTIGIDHQRNDPRGATWGALPYFDSDGQPAHLPRSGNLAARWSRWTRGSDNAFARLEHRFEAGASLRVAFNHGRGRLDRDVAYAGRGHPDPDSGAGLSVWAANDDWRERRDNAELALNLPFAARGREHELVLGWSGSRERGAGLSHALDVPITTIPDAYHWDGRLPRSEVIGIDSLRGNRVEQHGAYAALRWRHSARTTGLLGARVSSWSGREYRREFAQESNISNIVNNSESSHRDRDVVSPYAGLVVDVARDYSLYASYAGVFKPQTYRGRDGRTLPPERGAGIEAGIKGQWLDGRLDGSVAAFESRRDHIAVPDPSASEPSLPGGGQVYVSAGKGNRVRGYEFELSGDVSPQWSVQAGYTRQRMRAADGRAINTHLPEHLARLWLRYAPAGRWRDWRFGAGVDWQSAIHSLSWSIPPGHSAPARIAQSAYAVHGVSARYRIGHRLTLGLKIDNLFDRRYYRNVGFYDGVYWGEPRNLSLSLEFER